MLNKQYIPPDNFHDIRLANRCNKLINQVIAKPNVSIPNLSNKSNTKGVYRFFASQKFKSTDILKGHTQAVVNEIISCPSNIPIIVAQDTTYIDFTNKKDDIQDLGYLVKKYNFGIISHSSLAMINGVPIGLLDQQNWTRKLEDYGKKQDRKTKNFEDKESYCWYQSIKNIQELNLQNPVLIVGDRESDISILFQQEYHKNINLLIRAKSTRKLSNNQNLEEYLRCTDKYNTNITLPRNQEHNKDQIINCNLYFKTVQLKSSKNFKTNLSIKEIYTAQAILIQNQEVKINWLLITTLPVTNVKEALEVINYYKQRWLIERYHYTLKSGCRIEELGLNSKERLLKALAIYSVSACEILKLTYLSRTDPDLSCTQLFSEKEYKLICSIDSNSKKPPDKIPTLREITIMIAKRGGFQARKGDGYPGVKVIWKGMKEIQIMLEAIEVYGIFVGNG